MTKRPYNEITPYIQHLADKSKACCKVDSKFYEQYDVKRGLREENGKGVLVGLTNISEIKAKIEEPDGKTFMIPYVDAFIVDEDYDNNRLVIRLIEGIR